MWNEGAALCQGIWGIWLSLTLAWGAIYKHDKLSIEFQVSRHFVKNEWRQLTAGWVICLKLGVSIVFQISE